MVARIINRNLFFRLMQFVQKPWFLHVLFWVLVFAMMLMAGRNDDFSVLENVVLGVEGGALLKGGLAKARAALKALGDTFGLEVDPDALARDLPVGLQQRVEIIKALYRGAEILILDEPTGVLTPQEADQLFVMLKRFREQGKTVILITHKLREIMAITDRVTVMRQGAVVDTVDTAGTMVLAFNTSSETTFPGIGVAIRKATDAAGTMRATTVIRAGVASNLAFDAAGRNRFSDFLTIGLDPASAASWVHGQFSVSGPFQTWVAQVRP